jgi:hypothetical protein
MILRGQSACDKTGIPAQHADAFQEVADATGTVIASRAVGIYATGLILEGYSSKGFHNKAKSCNWGPMAGFVLDDPRFTKVGGTAKGQQEQQEALLHAIDERAVEVPLYISDDRRQWLQKLRLVSLVDRDSDSFLMRAVSPWGLALEFKLVREKPEGASKKMWAVRYRKADRVSAREWKGGGEWVPVMAMRDPLCTISASDYRAATTGDYDLFAAWARKANYSPDDKDRRMVSHGALESAIRAKSANTGEDAHLGNMTPRLRTLRDSLNGAILRRGYTGGNMVHHSDEGGRPFVGDIDLPIFAVVPGRGQCYCLEAVPDLREFITAELNQAFAPVFSPGWMKQLVFGADIAKATALKKDLLGFDRSKLKPPPAVVVAKS